MRYPTNWISITTGFHQGKSLDFGYCSHKYQNIYSIADGTILRAEIQKDGCKVIFIKHESGIVSCYGHLDSFAVKKGDKVILGQKIGTMGQTGTCDGMHLHLGIYSKEKADLGFNKKGLYGNADIDPFEVLFVYKDQDASKVKSPYKELLKYADNKEIWKVGTYRLLEIKSVRKSHNLGLNEYKVYELKNRKKYKWEQSELDKLVSQKPNDKAKWKKNSVLPITEIYNENGRIWGKYGAYGSDWVVLCNITGKPQAERIS